MWPGGLRFWRPVYSLTKSTRRSLFSRRNGEGMGEGEGFFRPTTPSPFSYACKLTKGLDLLFFYEGGEETTLSLLFMENHEIT